MKRIVVIALSIMLLLGVSFTILNAESDHKTGITKIVNVDIGDVDCTCGCGQKAIECLCENSIEDLRKAGFSMEDIAKYLEIQKV